MQATVRGKKRTRILGERTAPARSPGIRVLQGRISLPYGFLLKKRKGLTHAVKDAPNRNNRSHECQQCPIPFRQLHGTPPHLPRQGRGADAVWRTGVRTSVRHRRIRKRKGSLARMRVRRAKACIRMQPSARNPQTGQNPRRVCERSAHTLTRRPTRTYGGDLRPFSSPPTFPHPVLDMPASFAYCSPVSGGTRSPAREVEQSWKRMRCWKRAENSTW